MKITKSCSSCDKFGTNFSGCGYKCKDLIFWEPDKYTLKIQISELQELVLRERITNKQLAKENEELKVKLRGEGNA